MCRMVLVMLPASMKRQNGDADTEPRDTKLGIEIWRHHMAAQILATGISDPGSEKGEELSFVHTLISHTTRAQIED